MLFFYLAHFIILLSIDHIFSFCLFLFLVILCIHASNNDRHVCMYACISCCEANQIVLSFFTLRVSFVLHKNRVGGYVYMLNK